MKSIFTLCFIISFGFAYAQEPVSEQADTTITSYLNEIIISANRWEQNLRDVPGKVSKISGPLIQLQNPQTTADLLGISNSVFIQKSQLGGGSPMIRGFATNRVLLVVDGIRMNNAIFRSGNVQNVISLDANAVQEAEVVFGPGSVMYGSDAVGGVMDFHTLKPAFSDDEKTNFHVNALSRYSSANNEATGHIDFNIGLKRWAFLTSVTRSVYDDLKMGSNGPSEYTRPYLIVRADGMDGLQTNPDPNVQVPTGYDQWNAMQKINFKPAESINFNYALHYSATSDYSRYDRLILKENDQFVNAEWYYGPQKWLLHSLSASYTRPTPVSDQARIILAYQDYKESRHNRSITSIRRTNRMENVKAFSVNLDVDKKVSDLITFFYGAEYVTNSVGSVANRENVNTGEITSASTRYPDGSEWRTIAGYVSLKIKPSDRWLINLSNRFTHVYTHAQYDKTFFDFPFDDATLKNRAMNGSLGLIFSPSQSWKLYTNLSTGFRAPNVDDIGKVFDSEPGNVVVPNPDLEPELAYNAEFGFAGFIRDNLKIDLAGYFTVLDKAISRGPATFNGEDSIIYDGVLSRVLSLQNINQIKITGIQAGIDWHLAEGFKLSSTINYQKGKEKDAETGESFSPTHVAPLFGSTHFLYSNAKLKVDLYANYNGSIKYADLALSERADHHLYVKDEDGNPYSPSWWTLNFKFSYKLGKRITTDSGVENIFDKSYRPYSSGISAPGRNFIVSLRVAF